MDPRQEQELLTSVGVIQEQIRNLSDRLENHTESDSRNFDELKKIMQSLDAKIDGLSVKEVAREATEEALAKQVNKKTWLTSGTVSALILGLAESIRYFFFG